MLTTVVQIIVPGSQTTLAQLGLPESFTPARLRLPSHMFPAEKKGEWEPVKVRLKSPRNTDGHEAHGKVNTDTAMVETNGAGDDTVDLEEEVLYEEDPTTDEGAVWPIRAGRIVNWSCFFALLTHVYNTLSPPFHTPILVISQPAWTAHDHERLTQFFFEKFKTPAFCLMDSALAVCYAFATATATVVDVGHGKCDITAVSDFVVNDLGRGAALPGCGGEGMTQRLLYLLKTKGFTRDMCEQLKRSNICEVLLPGTGLPGTELAEENEMEDQIVNPASAASAGANRLGEGQRGSISAQSGIPQAVMEVDIVEEDPDREVKEGEDNEGVLDVASIVASGKTSEWVAKKEKEKAEKAAAKKAASDAAAAAPKLTRLPNSKRVKAMLHYNERRPLEDLNANGKRTVDPEGGRDEAPKRQKTPEPVSDAPPDMADHSSLARKEEKRRSRDTVAYVRKDVEVGVERFQATTGGIMDQIADSIHRSILSVPDISKRSELWDSLIIVGNGSKIKGVSHFPVLLLFYVMLTEIQKKRIQRSSPRHPKRKISHLPLQRHNFHVRASLQSYHSRRHRSQHASAATPRPCPQHIARPWPERESPPSRRNNRFQPSCATGPLAATAAVLPAAATIHQRRHQRHTLAAEQPWRGRRQRDSRARADTNEHQMRQDARVFPRVEGCRHGGSGVSRRASRGQGRVRRRSGLEQGVHVAHGVQ